MPIIGGAEPFLKTYDPVTGARINNFRLSTTIGLSCYPTIDGRVIWISRLTTQTVTPFYLETETKGSTVAIGANPVGIWYSPTERLLWKISAAGAISTVDMETGTITDAISLPVDVYKGLTGDSRFLWTLDLTTGSVKQVDRLLSTVVDGFTQPTDAADLHFDGRFLWIVTGAESIQGTIKQYDPFTGTEVGSFNITNYGLSSGPIGITGDGRFLYVTDLVQ